MPPVSVTVADPQDLLFPLRWLLPREVSFIPDIPASVSGEPVASPELFCPAGVADWPVEADSLSLGSVTYVSPEGSRRGSVVSLVLSKGDTSCLPPESSSLNSLESGEGASPGTPPHHTPVSSQH